MANKAVVLTAALGAGLYVASESFKEQQCEKEEQEEQQMLEDRFEESLRREEMRRAVHNDNGETTEAIKHFQNDAIHLRRAYLLDLLRQVRKVAKDKNSTRPVLGGVHLPLLDTELNSPDEVVFGAALAIGDEILLRKAFEQDIIRSSPTLALTKLTSSSLNLIVQVFQGDFGEAHFSPFCNVTKLDVGIVHAMFDLTIYNEDPIARPRTAQLQTNMAALLPAEWDALRQYAHDLGLNLCLKSAYTTKVVPASTSRAHPQVVYKYKGNRGIANVSPSEVVYLLNFEGDFRMTGHYGHDGSLHFDAGDIQPYKARNGNNKRGKRTATQEHSVNYNEQKMRQAATRILASLSTAHIATEAVKRLKFFQDGVVSIEHLAVACGVEGEFISDMRDGTIHMIDRNRQSIESKLESQLKHFIPPPDPSCPNTLEAEVSTFVQNYTRLLDLSYCVVPLWHGKPPSMVVAESNVTEEAMSFAFRPMLLGRARLQRRLELEERERLRRSRHIVSPPVHVVVGCLAVLGALIFWVAFEAMRFSIGLFISRYLSEYIYGFVLVSVSLILGGLTLKSTILLLKGPLQVSSKETFFCTAEAFAETVTRKWNVWWGRGTPFQQETLRLTKLCRFQHRIWQKRCARRDYYEALRRKKIAGDSLAGLLTAFATTVAKDCAPSPSDSGEDASLFQELRDASIDTDDGYVVGVLPGTLKEAEQFLEAEVIQNDADGGKKAKTFDSVFAAIEEDVAGLIQEFPVGARVKVSLGETTSPSLLAPMDGSANTLVSFGNSIGSVVRSYGGIVLVHLDGELQPIPIPSEFCVLIDEKTECFDMDTASDEVSNKDDETAIESNKDANGTAVETATESDDEVIDSTIDQLDEEQETGANSIGRACSVKDALIKGGWTLSRAKNHMVYKRKVISDDGVSEHAQSFTMSSTPSDRRSGRNALATLNRLNREHTPVEYPTQEGQENRRDCTICGVQKEKDCFSVRQWEKGINKCKDCVASLQ